jgi:hypothetical protein
MIADKLDQAKSNPEKDYHLKIDVRRVIKVIVSDNDHSDIVESELESLPSDHPIYRLIDSLDTWESSDHEEFESGINSALTALDDLYDLAVEEEWYSVASYSLVKAVEYREGLDGFDPSDQFDKVLDFLNNHFCGESDVHLGQLSSHVEKMIEHIEKMDEDEVESLLKIVEDRAENLEDNKQFMTERNYIDYIISIENHQGQDVESEQDRLVESFEEELDLKNSAKSMLKADILERAVAKCQPFLSDEKENDWRLRIRELNKEAIEEMPKIGHEVDVGEDVSKIIDHFKEIQNKRSSWEAFSAILYAPIGQGNYEQALERMGEAPAANMLSRNVLSSEGDSVGFEPGMTQEGDRAPSGYIPALKTANHTLTVALHRLIDENLVTEADFFLVLSSIPGVTVHDEAFLTDAIINLFEERYSEAVHIAVPRLESVTANTYEEMGKAVTKNQGKVYTQRGLGGLFGLIEEDISTNFGKYLQYRYTDTAGQNIRNKVAHGQIKYSAMNFKLAVTTIFDTFRVGARITAEYTDPSN